MNWWLLIGGYILGMLLTAPAIMYFGIQSSIKAPYCHAEPYQRRKTRGDCHAFHRGDCWREDIYSRDWEDALCALFFSVGWPFCVALGWIMLVTPKTPGERRQELDRRQAEIEAMEKELGIGPDAEEAELAALTEKIAAANKKTKSLLAIANATRRVK